MWLKFNFQEYVFINKICLMVILLYNNNCHFNESDEHYILLSYFVRQLILYNIVIIFSNAATIK